MARIKTSITHSEASALTWVANMGAMLAADAHTAVDEEVTAALSEIRMALVSYTARRVPPTSPAATGFMELSPASITHLADIIRLVETAPMNPSIDAIWTMSSTIALMELRTSDTPQFVHNVFTANPDATSPELLLRITSQWWARIMLEFIMYDVSL